MLTDCLVLTVPRTVAAKGVVISGRKLSGAVKKQTPGTAAETAGKSEKKRGGRAGMTSGLLSDMRKIMKETEITGDQQCKRQGYILLAS